MRLSHRSALFTSIIFQLLLQAEEELFDFDISLDGLFVTSDSFPKIHVSPYILIQLRWCCEIIQLEKGTQLCRFSQGSVSSNFTVKNSCQLHVVIVDVFFLIIQA